MPDSAACVVTTRVSVGGRNDRTQWQTRQCIGCPSASVGGAPMLCAAASCSTAIARHAASWQSSSCGDTADAPTVASDTIAAMAIRDAWKRNQRSIDRFKRSDHRAQLSSRMARMAEHGCRRRVRSVYDRRSCL